MELEKAQDILAHVVAQRVRWGNMWDASEIGLDKLTDALIAISQGDVSEAADLRQSLATANRQTGAANARETKLKKKITKLEQEIKALNNLVERLSQNKESGVADSD